MESKISRPTGLEDISTVKVVAKGWACGAYG